MIKRIALSLAITLAVSLVASLFMLNFNFNFIYTFLFTTLLQFLGFFFYGEYVRLRDSKFALIAEVKALEEISKISTLVACPCDRRIITEQPIDINGENTYMCEGCNKKIGILIQPKTVLLTEPLDQTLLDDPNFIAKLQKQN